MNTCQKKKGGINTNNGREKDQRPGVSRTFLAFWSEWQKCLLCKTSIVPSQLLSCWTGRNEGGGCQAEKVRKEEGHLTTSLGPV